MKPNPNKTYSVIVSRSRTSLSQHPPLSLFGVELETSSFLNLLRYVLDNKLTFVMHHLVIWSFYIFILLCFKYCYPVWCCGSNGHLRLLNCALGNNLFLLPDLSVDLEDRRKIASLSLLYNILNKIDHPLHCKLSQFAVTTHTTRLTSRQEWENFCFIKA